MNQFRLFEKWEKYIQAAVMNQVLYLNIKIKAMEGSKMAAWILACADHRIAHQDDMLNEMCAGLEIDPASLGKSKPVSTRQRGEIKGSYSERARKAAATRRANTAKKQKAIRVAKRKERSK